jgi:sRNA-binding protein
LFPALFSNPPKPLKLRIQADIQARSPGVFTKPQLSAFLRRYTGSYGYLNAMVKATHRYDLDGNPGDELSPEHRQAAIDELTRRRQNQQARLAVEEEQRRNRATLLRDFERTTLTPANFSALKGVPAEELEPLLARARQEAAEAPPPFERDRRGPPQDRPGRQGRPDRPERQERGGAQRPPREARGDRPPGASGDARNGAPRGPRNDAGRGPRDDAGRGQRRDARDTRGDRGPRGDAPRAQGDRPPRAPRPAQVSAAPDTAPQTAMAAALNAAKIATSPPPAPGDAPATPEGSEG